MANISIGAAGLVGDDQVGGISGVGHVQHKITLAASAQGACQHGFPGGSRAAAGIHVAGERRTIHIVLVRVTWLRQGRQFFQQTLWDLGNFLGAIGGRKAMQHAVVGTHVQHRRAAFLGRGKGAVAK